MNEKLRASIIQLCIERENSHMGGTPLLNWLTRPNGQVGLDVERFGGFQKGMRNIVTHDGKLIMSAYDFGLKGSARLRMLFLGLAELPWHDKANWSFATFFKIEQGVTVPYHLDEEKHEGFTRRTSLITFNVSAPDSELFVNTDGLDSNVGLSVSGYFKTVLCPTGIHHKVIVGRTEPMYLIQIPFKEQQ